MPDYTLPTATVSTTMPGSLKFAAQRVAKEQGHPNVATWLRLLVERAVVEHDAGKGWP